MSQSVSRRSALELLAGSAGVASLPVVASKPAIGGPIDADAGPRVTPNPIAARIQRSGVRAALVDVVAPPRSSTSKPFARLNYLFHANDGTGDLYVCDNRGPMWRIDGRTGRVNLFLDLGALRGSALLVDPFEMGLRSFAFHPDIARPGTVGFRKLYTMSTESVGSRQGDVEVLRGPYPERHHDVLTEWQVRATDRTVVDPTSRREVLRIAEYGVNHNADQVLFDITTRPGTPEHGRLFIPTGDGGGGPGTGDPYRVAQDPRYPLGKVLRIIPANNQGGRRYRIPDDNPFLGRAGHLPHLWAIGLRHPQNLCVDTGGTRRLILTDIGAANIEEVNLLERGRNYGWSRREGTFVTDSERQGTLYALGPNDARYGFTYPVAQYDHDDGHAITGGFVCRNAGIPALEGHYLCGDIVNGRIFHLPLADLIRAHSNGTQAPLRELTLQRNGQPTTLLQLVGANRVDLRFGQGQDGRIYVLSKQDGWIRRLAAV